MKPTEIESKLNHVLHQMVARCADPKDREVLRTAQIFHNVQGLPTEVVGISVPLNSGSNRVHISFTMRVFQQAAVETLAGKGLEDFQTVKSHSRKGGNG